MPIDFGSLPSSKVVTIPDNQARLVQIGVGPDGTGSLEFTADGTTYEVTDVPGAALGIVTTLKLAGKGFDIYLPIFATQGGRFMGLRVW